MNNELLDKINSMYENGKISEEQRDALIAALEENGNNDADKGAARNVFDRDSDELERDTSEVDDDLDDDSDDDSDDDECNASGKFSFTGEAGGKSLEAMLKNLGKQISEVVKSGTSAAMDAFSSTEFSLENAQSEFERAAAELSSLFGKGTMEKQKQVKYDTPYEKLNITVKYAGESSHIYSASAGDNPDLIKTDCAKFLPSEIMTKLTQLLDEHFTGTYKLLSSDFAFKFSVFADEQTQSNDE